MSDRELAIKLATENYDLRDRLKKVTEMSKHWYSEYDRVSAELQKCRERSIPIQYLSIDETIKALDDAAIRTGMYAGMALHVMGDDDAR